MVHRLINSDAHFLNKDTIGWHAITLLNVDDVTDDEVFDANRFSGSISSTINSELFPINLILETKELPIFTVVTQRCNDGLREETKVDGQALNIAVWLGIDGDYEVDCSYYDQENDVRILKLLSQDVTVWLNLWQFELVLAVNFLSSLNVKEVAVDAGVFLSAKKLEQTLGVAESGQDV